MSFLEIFQPGLKYLREERDRRRMLVAYPTNGGNPPMEIDLDAGTATIVISLPAPDTTAEAGPDIGAEATAPDEPAAGSAPEETAHPQPGADLEPDAGPEPGTEPHPGDEPDQDAAHETATEPESAH